MRKKLFRSLLASFSLIVFTGMMPILILPQEAFDVSDAPGDLSSVHQDSPGLKNCSRCHNEELEVPPVRCLSCHPEIALRISQNRGYHRDKGEDCIVCHSEHLGEGESIVVLDPEDFDHEETGAVLKGAHLKVKDCCQCHRKDNTLLRKKTRSFLFKTTGCLVCHISPHPGQQEKCLECHNQKNWEVDIWVPGVNR
jgi:hypothetical protein